MLGGGCLDRKEKEEGAVAWGEGFQQVEAVVVGGQAGAQEAGAGPGLHHKSLRQQVLRRGRITSTSRSLWMALGRARQAHGARRRKVAEEGEVEVLAGVVGHLAGAVGRLAEVVGVLAGAVAEMMLGVVELEAGAVVETILGVLGGAVAEMAVGVLVGAVGEMVVELEAGVRDEERVGEGLGDRTKVAM